MQVMLTKIFETEERPEIFVEAVHGNLDIKGWERAEVRIEYDREDELEASATGAVLRLRCRTNCQLRVPSSSSVIVGSVHGEACIESLQQKLEIGNVASNLNLALTGSSSVGNVGANLEARQIDGDLEVEAVGGHARVQNITGQFYPSP